MVEEAGVLGQNHRPWANNWYTLSLAAVSRAHPNIFEVTIRKDIFLHNKGRNPSNGKLFDFSFYIDSQKSAHRKFKK